jgi:hypothetical protein
VTDFGLAKRLGARAICRSRARSWGRRSTWRRSRPPGSAGR